MNKIIAFFKLARWPNLVFFALTQWMFSFCIITPVFSERNITPNLHGYPLALIIVSYILAAAGGYIINDYFDLNIDLVNKPDKVMIDKFIPRRLAIIFHILFCLLSIAFGFYVDAVANTHFMGIALALYNLLLFVYSLSLKKRMLIGNVLIAFLLAWVIAIISIAESNQFIHAFIHPIVNTQRLLRYTILYAGFAFIINLIREVVKDMEDIEGDRHYGCNTMPISWGINATKVFVAVWLVVLTAILTLLQFYALQLRWWWFSLYCIVALIVPLISIFKKLAIAQTPKEYHRISSLIKLVMFTGILSMFFFRVYG